MTKLVTVSGKKPCKILELLNFKKISSRGSHVRYVHQDGRRTVVPVHASEDLSIGLLKEILRQIKISKEKYEQLRLKV